MDGSRTTSEWISLPSTASPMAELLTTKPAEDDPQLPAQQGPNQLGQ
jgi:hypothetical protein